MAVEKDDWRLRGQEKYLIKKVWTWKPYYAPSATWDHDHCEFCFAKLMALGSPDTLDAGYVDDASHWVCKACFDDFKATFKWSCDEPA